MLLLPLGLLGADFAGGSRLPPKGDGRADRLDESCGVGCDMANCEACGGGMDGAGKPFVGVACGWPG